jgi:protein-disulfide isomerase
VRSYGPAAPGPRIVYNCRDETGGRTLTGLDVYTKKRGMLLILAALVATVFVGCGAGNSSQSSGQEEQQRESQTAGSPEKTASQTASSSEQASGERLGHPALGSADAPVVLTEYSDYQ